MHFLIFNMSYLSKILNRNGDGRNDIRWINNISSDEKIFGLTSDGEFSYSRIEKGLYRIGESRDEIKYCINSKSILNESSDNSQEFYTSITQAYNYIKEKGDIPIQLNLNDLCIADISSFKYYIIASGGVSNNRYAVDFTAHGGPYYSNIDYSSEPVIGEIFRFNFDTGRENRVSGKFVFSISKYPNMVLTLGSISGSYIGSSYDNDGYMNIRIEVYSDPLIF